MKTNKINTNNLDNFFSYVSKAVIIIPIFIFVLSLMIKFGQSNTKNTISEVTPPVSVSPTSPTVNKINKIPIDLIGPWTCQYQDGQKQYVLTIKNKNVNLQVKENNQLKKYDLTSYVPLVEGFLNNDISSLENMINQYSGKKVDLQSILKSCKKTS